ncbi:FadR/GntR family transcriptional regulator [Geomicrobium sp. JCM 19039]|uniref:FadR/GntR family transcriptional regulator n=1 Tax=Geomicrobium sp. JCM 19039 TaxID=1460636 RepID=UPI000694703C|nr:FadR/GntR family transcriptional regulator [Geomicrobium sp. JCM 19039]
MTKRISEQVSEQIESWITSKMYEPREKLPSTRELCDQFSVSRSSVRDALTSLKGKGLITIVQGEGIFVADTEPLPSFQFNLSNEQTVHELFAVRKIVEAGIAFEAAQMRTEAQLKELDSLLADGWEADYAFHLALANCTGNLMLVQLLESISTSLKKALQDCHQLIANDPGLTKAIHDQHTELYAWIQAGDATRSREAMHMHLTYVETLLKEAIQEGGRTNERQ